MRRVLSLAFGLTLICAGICAGAAAAQEAIPSAGGAQSQASPTINAPPSPIGPRYEAMSDDLDRPAMGPCGPVRKTADGKVDDSPRGQVDVGVGTGGYRHIGGYVCKPIGEHAAVSVAVSETQYRGRGGRRRW